MANRIPQQVLDDKETVIRLDVSNAEFHFVFEALWSIRHYLAGDLVESLADHESAVKWARKIGEEGIDSMLERLNKIQEATCPGFKEG